MESLRTGTAVAEKRGCSRWECGETIEKGSICHDERVAYRPFVVSGMPKDGAVRAEGPEAPSPGQRPGYM